MWRFKPHRLFILLGLCILIMGMFLESTEASGMMKRHNNRQSTREKLKSLIKKRKQRKQQHRQRTKTKPINSKSTKTKEPVNTKISVYNCPSEAVEMNCLSCKTKVYRKCPIAAAAKITKVQVLKEYPDSYGKCNVGRKENFGFIDDSNIWVNYGCRAKFLVCYEKGKHEPKTINCMCATSKHNCPTGLQGVRVTVDIKVTILWSFGPRKCIEGQSWGFTKDYIWVNNGCSATFRVLW